MPCFTNTNTNTNKNTNTKQIQYWDHRHSRLSTEVPQADALLHKLRDDGGVAVSSCYVYWRHTKLKKKLKHIWKFVKKKCNLIFIQGWRSATDEELDDISVTSLSGNVEWGWVRDTVPAKENQNGSNRWDKGWSLCSLQAKKERKACAHEVAENAQYILDISLPKNS